MWLRIILYETLKSCSLIFKASDTKPKTRGVDQKKEGVSCSIFAPAWHKFDADHEVKSKKGLKSKAESATLHLGNRYYFFRWRSPENVHGIFP